MNAWATRERWKAWAAPQSTIAVATRHPLRVIAWPAFSNRQQNPYNALLYERLAGLGVRVDDFYPQRLLFGRYDIWHLHWPEAILNLPRPWQALPLALIVRFLLRVARARGIKIVWTVHNLRSHEGRYPDAEDKLWRALMRRLDGFIALSDMGRELALRRFPTLRHRPSFVIPHGPYHASDPDTISHVAARERLGLPANARVILSLGQIRPYKNLPHLIDTIRQLPDPDVQLLIAGYPADADTETAVRAARGDDPRTHLHCTFIPTASLPLYFRAADLVVLPYREILNSGSAILALSFARPLLVPAQGALCELAQRAGAAWVRTYTGELQPATIREALDWAAATPRDPAQLFRELSWETIARQTLLAYQAISDQSLSQ